MNYFFPQQTQNLPAIQVPPAIDQLKYAPPATNETPNDPVTIVETPNVPSAIIATLYDSPVKIEAKEESKKMEL